MRTTQIALAIASVLACSLCTACGGGGGGGMVRNSPAPTAPPPIPAPAPLSNTVTCPSAGNCVLDIPATNKFLAQITSPYSLDKQGPGGLLLHKGSYQFSAGATIHAGFISVHEATLRSDVAVMNGTWLHIEEGSIEGDISNQGRMSARASSIVGDVANHGLLQGGKFSVQGNFSQTPEGTYSIVLPVGESADVAASQLLRVSGTAHLAGTLQLDDNPEGRGWGNPLPSAGVSHHLIHAGGGVFGTFDRWTSPGLFIEGSLRYGSHDVWFDLTRISLASAMAGQGFGGITLASAGNLDHALAIADGFAGNPGIAQQQFLASAGRLLWMRDPLQAQRALDTLSGLPQAQALDAALHEAGMSPVLSAHMDRRARTQAAGAWSHAGVAGMHSGVDQWLGPQLLAGVHAARGHGAQADAMLDANAQRDERRAGAYLRWFGNDGWYAGADAGYAQRTMLLDRSIDFGAADRWNAHSRRTLDVASLGGEAGRRLPFAGGRLTPFLRLDAAAVHGARAVEQGGSGFELALDPVTQRRLATGIGLRYARDWRFSDGNWLQLQASAGMQQTLWQGGDAQRAAFTGAPGAWFDLPGLSQRRSSWLELGLHGGFGHDWHWAMQGMHGDGQKAWQLRLARDF